MLLSKINAKLSGIVLTDFIQTNSGIVLHAITKNRSLCCPYCGEPSLVFMTIDIVSCNAEMFSQNTKIMLLLIGV